MEELQLIEALLSGERDAPKLFVERYSGLIYGILLRDYRLRREDADDCFQTIFEKLIQNNHRIIRQWRMEGTFAAYLSRIVRNVAVDWIANNNNINRRHSEVDEEEIEAVPDLAPPLENLMLLNELRRILLDCMNRLTDKARHIIGLKHLENHSYQEIAVFIGCDISNVGVTLYRAEHRLRDCMRQRTKADFSAMLP